MMQEEGGDRLGLYIGFPLGVAACYGEDTLQQISGTGKIASIWLGRGAQRLELGDRMVRELERFGLTCEARYFLDHAGEACARAGLFYASVQLPNFQGQFRPAAQGLDAAFFESKRKKTRLNGNIRGGKTA